MFKYQQVFSPDPARLVQKEKQLRDYHIRNWLTMNRSTKELLELSLNHFYGEHPKLLGWSLDIIDGDPKGLVIAAMVRESRCNAAQADLLYEQLQSRINQCKALVDEVARNTSLSTDQSKQMLKDRITRVTAPARPQVLIINRPTMIVACAILLFLSAALTTLFVLVEFPGMSRFLDVAGTPGLIFSIAITALCGWGYWNMKRWAVLLYALEPIARFLLDMPHVVIAVPMIVAIIGLMHIDEMTWT
jgi:hypothetical protein